MNSIIEAQHEYWDQNVGIVFDRNTTTVHLSNDPQTAMEKKLQHENGMIPFYNSYVPPWMSLLERMHVAKEALQAINFRETLPLCRCKIEPR
jgi:hypothetical protein